MLYWWNGSQWTMQAIVNQAQVSNGQQMLTESAMSFVNGLEMCLPQIQRH